MFSLICRFELKKLLDEYKKLIEAGYEIDYEAMVLNLIEVSGV